MIISVIGVQTTVPFKRELASLIKKEFGWEACFPQPIPFSVGTLDEKRRQYNAKKLLEELRAYVPAFACAGSKKVLWITDKDIFVDLINFVFGLSELHNRDGILSIARLREEYYGRKEDKALYKKRFLCESLHEIGHLFGLGHCRNDCVMRFSNNIEEVDLKTMAFCDACRAKLNALEKE